MIKLILFLLCTTLSFSILAQENGSSLPPGPKLKFNGDFRYRFQTELDGDDNERITNKLRVRLGLSSEISDRVSLNFRLMSYSKPETSQSSGNFNMGDSSGYGFQRRLVGLDHAYVDYHPLDSIRLQLGKVPMSLVFVGKSQMVLDSDLALEGAAFYSTWSFDEKIEGYLNLGYFVVAENFGSSTPKVDETDNVIYTPQLGIKTQLNNWNLKAMLSKVSYVGLKGDAFSHTCCINGSVAKGRGNTEGSVSGTFLNDYDITEYGLEAKTKMDAYELTIFIQNFVNTAVKSKNKGNWVGFSIVNGPYSVNYGQGRSEADAVVASFTDADLAKGETDSFGQQVAFQYKVSSNWLLAVTKYDSEYRLSMGPTRYRRMSIDSQWNF